MSDQSASSNSRQSARRESAENQGADVDVWADALTAMGTDSGTLNEAQIMDLLSHVVESEIIPRLMLAHQNFSTPSLSIDIEAALSDEAIEHFARLCIAGEVDDLEDRIVALTRQGVAADSVYLELMAPAARKLGLYWEQDLCSFTDVTIGLGRLQTLLYRLSARHKGIDNTEALVTKGLFVTPTGGQHSFGIRMVEDLFRRAGWKTLCEPNISMQELVFLVQTEVFDLVGVGITTEVQLDLAKEMINQIRENSRNPGLKIMVGGNLIVENPENAALLGADFSAIDAREAVTIAQNIIYGHKMRH